MSKLPSKPTTRFKSRQSHSENQGESEKSLTTSVYEQLVLPLISSTTTTPQTISTVNKGHLPFQTKINIGWVIEEESKLLLETVNTLVDMMEKMIFGPIALEHNLYEMINSELESMYKTACIEDAKGEELSRFHVRGFNRRFLTIENCFKDIYMTWLHNYSVALQDIVHQCQVLIKLLNDLKKRNKKQKALLHNIIEFSSYAAAQKNSVFKLTQEKYIELPLISSTEEVFLRIETLKKRLNTSLPICFGNLPKPTTVDKKTEIKGKKKRKSIKHQDTNKEFKVTEEAFDKNTKDDGKKIKDNITRKKKKQSVSPEEETDQIKDKEMKAEVEDLNKDKVYKMILWKDEKNKEDNKELEELKKKSENQDSQPTEENSNKKKKSKSKEENASGRVSDKKKKTKTSERKEKKES